MDLADLVAPLALFSLGVSGNNENGAGAPCEGRAVTSGYYDVTVWHRSKRLLANIVSSQRREVTHLISIVSSVLATTKVYLCVCVTS